MIRSNIKAEELPIISKLLDTHYQLSYEAKEMLLGELNRIEMKKGDLLYSKKDSDAYIYFMTKGAVKNYGYNQDGEEEVYWFGLDHEICIRFDDYVKNRNCNENIVVCEPSVLYRVGYSYLLHLYEKNLEWANWGRCIAEHLAQEMSSVTDFQKYMTAKERYELLLKQFPQITQRMPLQDIANYLGITPVSLSRIRAQR